MILWFRTEIYRSCYRLYVYVILGVLLFRRIALRDGEEDLREDERNILPEDDAGARCCFRYSSMRIMCRDGEDDPQGSGF